MYRLILISILFCHCSYTYATSKECIGNLKRLMCLDMYAVFDRQREKLVETYAKEDGWGGHREIMSLAFNKHVFKCLPLGCTPGQSHAPMVPIGELKSPSNVLYIHTIALVPESISTAVTLPKNTGRAWFSITLKA